MQRLEQYTLLVLGRSVDFDGSSYYMSPSHYNLLAGMAERFNNAVYLCQERRTNDTEGLSRIDESILQVEANDIWKQTGNVRKLASLLKDYRVIQASPFETIAYIYYPGFYSFLLSPLVFRHVAFSIGHFGSDAIDTANAAYDTNFLDRAKGRFYESAQRYVLDTLDIAFATDPRMEARHGDRKTTFVESAPVIDFDLNDLKSQSATPCDDEPIRLLFVGVFRPVKGLEYLIQAFSTLVDRSNRQYRLCLVGDGTERKAIESLVESLGLKDLVEFTGYIGDKEGLIKEYKKSDIFIVPSLKESVPRVIYEAAAMGLPVVATRVGGIPFFLTDHEDALLVESRNSNAIAAAVEEIVADAALRSQMIENLQSEVEWYLSTDPVKQRLDLITEEFIQKKSPKR